MSTYKLFTERPDQSGEYLVAFSPDSIKGEYIYCVCCYDSQDGWIGDVPCKSYDFKKATAWCKIPRVSGIKEVM